MSEQVITLMAEHCPGIERGNSKWDRLKAGANYAETVHKTVAEMHGTLIPEYNALIQKNEELAALIVTKSPEFQALWNRIKHKTTYRVHFDNDKLVADCAKAIGDGPPVSKARVRIRKADLSIGQGGVEAKERDKNSGTVVSIEEGDIALPDVLTEMQDRTQLTRKSLVNILTASGRLSDFKRNPQAFIEIAAETINRTKRLALVDGIKYQKIGEDEYYAQELFQQEELMGYLKNMLQNATKSVFEHVIYDSGGVERTFAEQLEKNEAVKIYAKLPAWFKVPTPLGTYNPDWAVLDLSRFGAAPLIA